MERSKKNGQPQYCSPRRLVNRSAQAPAEVAQASRNVASGGVFKTPRNPR
jgi:hypothetical protein